MSTEGSSGWDGPYPNDTNSAGESPLSTWERHYLFGHLAVVCPYFGEICHFLTILKMPAVSAVHVGVKDWSMDRVYEWLDSCSLGDLTHNLQGIIGVFLNLPIVYSAIKRWKSLDPHEYFVLNLALADLCSICFAYPPVIISASENKWVSGKTGCVVIGFFTFFWGMDSMATTAVISFIRLRATIYSSGRNTLTMLKAGFVVIYTHCFLWSLCPLLGFGSYGLEPSMLSCTVYWADPELSFIMVIFIFCFLLPAFIMICTNIRVVFVTRSNLIKQKKHPPKKSKQKENAKELILVKYTLALCVGCLVLWSPYTIVNLMCSFGDCKSLSIRKNLFTVVLAKSSVIVNPIIYLIMHKKLWNNVREFVAGRQRSMNDGSATGNDENPHLQTATSGVDNDQTPLSPTVNQNCEKTAEQTSL